MARDFTDGVALSKPRPYATRMVMFLIIVGFLLTILGPQLREAFMANPGLNGLIAATLLVGILYSFRQVLTLGPEVKWVNAFRRADPGLALAAPPRLLAPMATMLGERTGPMRLTALSMRSLLDSIGSRLDESREISRYTIGLLIFLGLLGTFWGLLATVSSVGDTIRSLDVTNTDSVMVFTELRTNLEAPLSGMGTAFSSSLFGLAGSLILGFLDLQAGQAQNRFYNELEEWLSTVTSLAMSGGEPSATAPDAIDALTAQVADLSNQLHQEQALLRQLALNQEGLKPTLDRLADALNPDTRR